MYRSFIYFAFAVLAAGLLACSNGNKNIDGNAQDGAKAGAEPGSAALGHKGNGNNMGLNVTKPAGDGAKRKKIESIHKLGLLALTDMLAFLPKQINGFETYPYSGGLSRSAGETFSSLLVDYVSPQKQHIQISIYDYGKGAAIPESRHYTDILPQEMGFEPSWIEISGQKGFLLWDKAKRSGKSNLLADNRFVIKLQAKHLPESIDGMPALYDDIDIKGLTALGKDVAERSK